VHGTTLTSARCPRENRSATQRSDRQEEFLFYNQKEFDMSTDFSYQKKGFDTEPASSNGIQESIYPNEHEINITDGGEFMDDAIRMKDQPFGEIKTKENE
jgi:hypothetical protein